MRLRQIGYNKKDSFLIAKRRAELNQNHSTLNLNINKKQPRKQLVRGDILLDRYEIQAVIGLGGMGSVYRARDKNFKTMRLVAIKEMINKVMDNLVQKNINAIFEREANILASIRHHAIPRIFDFFTINDCSYLVMDYVNGKDLDDSLAKQTSFFHEKQVMDWAIQICDVLSYLHSFQPEPIVFRDIKPSNIMINQQGQIMLVDFGIAKIFQEGQKNTMIGTQGYSPPEQYRGEATPMVDIYALGATMHHLLTLKDPRLEAPFSFDERPIKNINPVISNDLIGIIEKCLQYNPDDRFQKAEEMKEALLNAGRRTGLLHAQTYNSQSNYRNSDAIGIKPIWSFSCEDEIRSTPIFHDNTVFISCLDNNVYAINAKDGKFKWKFPTDGPLTSSPEIYDNNLIFGSSDSRLYSINSIYNRENWAFFAEAPIRSAPCIAEGHVFFGSDDSNLYAVNLKTGRLAWKSETSDKIRSKPAILDEKIYFGNDRGDFYCFDFQGNMKWTFNAKRSISSTPLVKDNVVYFTSLDSMIYALDINSGWVIWKYRMDKGSMASPYIVDDKLIVGSADSNLYCLDITSSKEVWRFKTEHQIVGQVALYNNKIYCGSGDHHIYCIDLEKGTQIWKYKTEGSIIGGPTIYDGVVYFGSTDKNLYALIA